MLRRATIRLWLLDHLHAGLLARPAEWFLAFLCVLSGSTAVTRLADSTSVEALLPSLIYRLWGLCLVVGGLGLLCGLSSIRGLPDGRHVVTRLPCYRLGLRLLGLATAVYATALVIVAGAAAVFALPAILAFSAMCGIRLLTLAGRP